jgi:hypothetical protein
MGTIVSAGLPRIASQMDANGAPLISLVIGHERGREGPRRVLCPMTQGRWRSLPDRLVM